VSTIDYSIDNATATQRGDFTFGRGTVVFNANESSKTFRVLISEDAYAEGVETATLSLSNAVGATIGSPGIATLQINDNESVDGSANPLDDAPTYVCQHYHDFLNRQSDSDGQAFWTNQITSCGSNASCLDEKRNNVSAAFFLSIEFQETGYLVYRIYKAAYGNLTVPAGACQPASPTNAPARCARLPQVPVWTTLQPRTLKVPDLAVLNTWT